MDERDVYNDLLRYMEDVGRNLDEMLRCIDMSIRELNKGLAVNGVIYKDRDMHALRDNIIQKKDIIWNIVVPRIRDAINSL